MYKIIKAQLSKANFLLGRNPIVEKTKNWKCFIPEPYKAVVTITADFELAWAWRYSKTVTNPLERALQKANLEVKNIPIILGLCEKYNIPITWATVGHLFLSECNSRNNLSHKNIPRLKHFENKYWKYFGKDWFEYDPCSNYRRNPEWYSPDLISKIINSKIKHEIGCHTFSHIDCSEEVCSSEVFEAEVNECKKEASKRGLELKSFVHPGHTIGHLNKLVELGFTSFQSDSGNVLGYPVKHKNGLWELKRTYEFGYRKEWEIDYHIYRYKKIIDRAIHNKSVCNFWFHPSFNKCFLDDVFPEILEYINNNSENLLAITVSKYFEMLKEING